MIKILSLLATCSLFSAPAFAGSLKNHHCEMNGSAVDQGRTDCRKNGGKWMKGAPSASPATGTNSTPTNDSMRRNGSVESGYPPNENAPGQAPGQTLPVQNESNNKKAASTQPPAPAPSPATPAQNEGNDKSAANKTP